MKTKFLASAFLLLCKLVLAQGFVNLNFEQSTIVSSSPSAGGAYDSGTANVAGWTVFCDGLENYAGGMTVNYNLLTLDAPCVALEGTNFPSIPSIQKKYSLWLFGGDFIGTNGVYIAQTGQIPNTAQSLTYWGLNYNNLVITFNGQLLSFNTISNTANYTIYGTDVSAFAGQTGELRFTAPWSQIGSSVLAGSGIVDNIQFSSSPVPEPSGFLLIGLGLWLLIVFKLQKVSPRNLRHPIVTLLSLI